MVDLVITCDEIIERTKTVPKKFIEKESACKILKFYILLAFFSYLCIMVGRSHVLKIKTIYYKPQLMDIRN